MWSDSLTDGRVAPKEIIPYQATPSGAIRCVPFLLYDASFISLMDKILAKGSEVSISLGHTL